MLLRRRGARASNQSRHLDRSDVLHSYAVDTALFEQQRGQFTRETVRSELGIPNDRFVILYSGKLIARKAPLLLMQALSQLPDISKVMVLMVGDGPMREEVESTGRALLGDRLMMAGFVNQSQIGKYYSAADLFVLPSQHETWGVVVNEAMEFGVPAVVTRKVGCRRDLVIEGETGLSFEVNDAAGCALPGPISSRSDAGPTDGTQCSGARAQVFDRHGGDGHRTGG